MIAGRFDDPARSGIVEEIGVHLGAEYLHHLLRSALKLFDQVAEDAGPTLDGGDGNLLNEGTIPLSQLVIYV